MKAKIGDKEHLIEQKSDGLKVNGQAVPLELLSKEGDNYYYNSRGRNYKVEIVECDADTKEIVVKVNGKKTTVKLRDRYDELLASMGLDTKANKKQGQIKAPMPGMVLKLLAQEGQQILKGDSLLLLEAMKMENIIKSPVDGLIKKIYIAEKDKVEKNQVMIEFG